MNTKTQGTIEILAALFVLFSAMLAPLLTAVVSIIALVAIGIYKYVSKEK